MKVEFYKHSIESEDIDACQQSLQSLFLAEASQTQNFEIKLSQFVEANYCVAVSSCTAALHLSLLALDIGVGDEVICPATSFVATSNSVIYTGARPVFVDIDSETALLDPNKIEAAITSQTKAILAVHLYGSLCDMQAIKRIADKYDLKIIEDAAHCIEGKHLDYKPGSLSDVACFSFYATKNLTCGEGGAVVCRDKTIYDRIKRLKSHGISKSLSERHAQSYQHWDMLELGYKYTFNDILASLLIRQIDRLEEQHGKREKICQYYEEELASIGLRFPRVPQESQSARHLFTFWTHNRDSVMAELQSTGVGVGVHYRSIDQYSFYKNYLKNELLEIENAQKLGSQTISLPLYPKLTELEVEYVAEQVKRAVKKCSL